MLLSDETFRKASYASGESIERVTEDCGRLFIIAISNISHHLDWSSIKKRYDFSYKVIS